MAIQLGKRRALGLLVKWLLGILAVVEVFKAIPIKLKARALIVMSRVPFLSRLVYLPALLFDVSSLLRDKCERNSYKNIAFTMMGKKNLICCESSDVEHVLKTNWQNYVKNTGPVQLQLWGEEVIGSGIFAVDGEDWKRHRKVASVMFSRNALKKKMEQVFRSHSEDLLNRLLKTNRPFDLQLILTSFTFDTICEIAFGHHPRSLEKAFEGKQIPFLAAFDKAQQVSAARVPIPDVVWMFMRRHNLGFERTIKNCMAVIDKYILDVVQQRKQELRGAKLDFDPESSDLVSLYILHAKKWKDEEMESDKYLMDVVKSFMLAGRDTTAYTSDNLFLNLSRNRKDERQVLEELKTIQDTSFDSLRQCKHLDACLNETLRMYPPVGVDIKGAHLDDVLPSGCQVKAGTLITVPIYAIGRNKELFKDPDTFNPRRWYKEDGTVGFVSQYVQPIFWGGPRICLGKEAARLEAKILLATILPKVEITTVKAVDSFFTAPVSFRRSGHIVQVKART